MIILFLFLFLFQNYESCFKERQEVEKIIIYNKGEKMELEKNSPFFCNIVLESEKILNEADDKSAAMVYDHYRWVKKARKKNVAIEIFYRNKKILNNRHFYIERKLTYTRILVVYYRPPMVSIYCGIEAPKGIKPKELWDEFISSKGSPFLIAILDRLGIKLKDLESGKSEVPWH